MVFTICPSSIPAPAAVAWVSADIPESTTTDPPWQARFHHWHPCSDASTGCPATLASVTTTAVPVTVHIPSPRCRSVDLGAEGGEEVDDRCRAAGDHRGRGADQHPGLPLRHRVVVPPEAAHRP